ncbi:hypothetical protein NIES2100_25900 [Calothrix sp. NIES-2100]|uniref:hypothetical protein n=1 Tax=Calothrix sp. NIES-2100 TaxID=1954172 RepID=UPI000B61E4DC|nr:hypothetical protein NIES2100_25900 [Calothrix sp. NIES-2100]
MKSAPLALAVVIGALTITQSAYANQKNVPIATNQNNQARVLATKPVTLLGKWGYSLNQNNSFPATANTIALEQNKECKKLNPFEIIKNPNILFTPCQQPTTKTTAQLAEPIEYFKVPPLDSGIKVTVSNF